MLCLNIPSNDKTVGYGSSLIKLDKKSQYFSLKIIADFIDHERLKPSFTKVIKNALANHKIFFTSVVMVLPLKNTESIHKKNSRDVYRDTFCFWFIRGEFIINLSGSDVNPFPYLVDFIKDDNNLLNLCFSQFIEKNLIYSCYINGRQFRASEHNDMKEDGFIKRKMLAEFKQQT